MFSIVFVVTDEHKSGHHMDDSEYDLGCHRGKLVTDDYAYGGHGQKLLTEDYKSGSHSGD